MTKKEIKIKYCRDKTSLEQDIPLTKLARGLAGHRGYNPSSSPGL